ncbi:hypothetical protein DEO72_LG4g550 [Vigna unguiculata]|uniref:Uncharacterized protein n=1 Tax=Vigna unguiculata TaxID=3917 RepID=A0A4D6LNK4_VIGUN|nr:hypothetical protein DEO72_LG4g550 [Vigna unguiculata]
MWYDFGILCARPILQVSPKRAISPKLELQNLVSVLGSRCSLRRLVLELSDRDSCLGESGSPKRGRDGNLYHFSSNPRPGEARWASLSEIEVLASANRHGLSEREVMFLCTVWTVCLLFPKG